MLAIGSKSTLASVNMSTESSALSPKFDWGLTESYYLSVQLCLDGLSFSIQDPVTNTYLLLTSVNFSVPDPNFAKHEEYMLTHKPFGYKYRKVIVSIDSPAFTLMPTSLFDEKRANEVLALLGINIHSDDRIIHNHIELASATCVFAIPNFLYYFLRTQFPGVVILHRTTPLVSSLLLKRSDDKKDEIVNLVFTDDSMIMVAAKRNELRLCNKYYCKSVADYVYITLFALSQIGFEHHQTSIVYSGDVAENNPICKELSRFVGNVTPAQSPSFFNYEFTLPHNIHKHHTLFLIPLCV